jgi:hypothetical protein
LLGLGAKAEIIPAVGVDSNVALPAFISKFRPCTVKLLLNFAPVLVTRRLQGHSAAVRITSIEKSS